MLKIDFGVARYQGRWNEASGVESPIVCSIGLSFPKLVGVDCWPSEIC